MLPLSDKPVRRHFQRGRFILAQYIPSQRLAVSPIIPFLLAVVTGYPGLKAACQTLRLLQRFLISGLAPLKRCNPLSCNAQRLRKYFRFLRLLSADLPIISLKSRPQHYALRL